MTLTLLITFTSDWHPGTGSGREGSTDRLVRRDADGLPTIPGRSLRGLWRDAAESLADALDGPSGPGAWAGLVAQLFGSQPAIDRAADRRPIPGRLRCSPARLVDAGWLTQHPDLVEALCFLSPSVKIEAKTGAADQSKLYFTELVRAGAVLQATAELDDVPDAHADEVRRFLAAAAEGIRALGGKRRRGRGRCQVRVREQPEATEAFFAQISAPPALGDRRFSLAKASGAAAAGTSEWRQFELKITPLEPLILHQRTLGNVVESLDRVPGAVLLAALGRDLARAGLDLSAALAAGDLLIREGRLQIGGARGAPAPLCLSHDKYEDADHRRPVSSSLDPSPPKLQQAKQLRAGFCAPTQGAALVIQQVVKQVTPHNVIHDQDQRPTEEVGGFYAYEAVSPPAGRDKGQIFLAQVLVRGAAVTAMKALVGTQTRVLGRSTGADYGRCEVEIQAPEDPSAPPVHPTRLTIWLQSPLLLRDAALRPTVNPKALEDVLSARLGGPVTWQPEPSRLRTVRLESWQRSWGLPRPTLVGLAPGSVLVFALTGTPGAQALRDLAIEGLGERRGEGMGELLLNAEWLAQPPRHLEEKDRARGQETALLLPPVPTDQEPFRALIWREAAGAILLRAVAAAQVPEAFQRLNERERSQVGALRTALLGARSAEEAARAWVRPTPPRDPGQEDDDASEEQVRVRASRPRYAVKALLDDGVWTRLSLDLHDAGRESLKDEALRLLLDRWCQVGLGRAPQTATPRAAEQEVPHGA